MQPGEGSALLKTRLTHSSGDYYEFIIKGGDKYILESFIGVQPLQPGGPRKYGDYDPSFGHIQMSTWERGWGGKDFSEDEGRFLWSSNMWTATRNVMFPVPRFYHGGDDVIRTAVCNYSGSIWEGSFTPANTDSFWASSPFTTVAAMNVKHLHTYIRYKGAGTLILSAAIYTDSSGAPGTQVGNASATVNITQSQKNIFVPVTFTWSTLPNLTAATNYHIVIKLTLPSGEANNLVTIAAGPSTFGAGDISYNSGSSWAIHDAICFYLSARRQHRKIKFLELNRQPFALAIYNSGNNRLYMMGDHGIATAGGANTITDTNEGVRGAWTANQWAGDKIILVSGTGAGQARTVDSNDTVGGIIVTEDWEVNPAAGTEYAIISKDEWHEIGSGTHGIANCESFTVANGIAYFAEGAGQNIRRMRFDPATSGLNFADDGTNDADLIFAGGGRIWRGTNDDGIVSYADLETWGTNLTFTDLTIETPTGSSFNGAGLHGGNVYFIKDDSVWLVDSAGDVLYEYPVSMKYFYSDNNGRSVAAHQEYLYFPWGGAMQRLAGLSLEHVDPNRDEGMDSDYTGKVSAVLSHPAGMFFAVNGGAWGDDNISSVNIYDGIGFHNAFTLQFPGVPIHDIAWVNVEDDNPYLLIAVGDTIFYQIYPKDTSNPLKDSGMAYHIQGELVTSTIDMGTKSLTKIYKDLDVFMRDVVYIPPTSYSEVNIFYDLLDGDGWTHMATVQNVARGASEQSFTDPDLATLNALSDVKEIRFKVVIYHRYSEVGQIYAMTLKGMARTPIKSVYSFPIDISSVTNRLGSGDPVTMANDLITWAQEPNALLLTSQHNRLHNKAVAIIPRALRTQYIDRSNENFAADMYLELREL